MMALTEDGKDPSGGLEESFLGTSLTRDLPKVDF